MKCYLDVDGVFADFDHYIQNVLGIKEERWSDAIWKPIGEVPNFFGQLPLMEDSLELIVRLDPLFDLEFLTALPQPTGFLNTADADKRKWLAKNVSSTIKVNTIVGGKNKVKFLVDNPGAILIDDYQRNIDLWEEAGGIGILFTSVPATWDKMMKRGLL
jgi:5'-nucleotidase